MPNEEENSKQIKVSLKPWLSCTHTTSPGLQHCNGSSCKWAPGQKCQVNAPDTHHQNTPADPSCQQMACGRTPVLTFARRLFYQLLLSPSVVLLALPAWQSRWSLLHHLLLTPTPLSRLYTYLFYCFREDLCKKAGQLKHCPLLTPALKSPLLECLQNVW